MDNYFDNYNEIKIGNINEFKSALINENYEQCAKIFDENVKNLVIYKKYHDGLSKYYYFSGVYNLYMNFFRKIYKNIDILNIIKNDFKYIFIGDIIYYTSKLFIGNKNKNKAIEYYKLSKHKLAYYRLYVAYNDGEYLDMFFSYDKYKYNNKLACYYKNKYIPEIKPYYSNYKNNKKKYYLKKYEKYYYFIKLHIDLDNDFYVYKIRLYLYWPTYIPKKNILYFIFKY